jgi:tetratricopeptide (TPR) repeat protein
MTPTRTDEPVADAPFRHQSDEPEPIRETVHCSSGNGLTEPATPAELIAQHSERQAAASEPVQPLDAETRYALGMAYKDMGLLEEAKEEFFSSMKDPGFFVDSCLMMASCLKEQNQCDHAIQLLEKLVADSRCREGNVQIVRYELGLLYEKISARDRAIAMYQSIPSFYDVPQRLQNLRADTNANGTSASHQASHRPRAMQDSRPL